MSGTDDTTGTADVATSTATSSVLLNQPIVIDNGTATIKAGFAGGLKPKVVIGNKVGRAKHMRIMPGGSLEQESSSSSYFVGRKLDEHRGAFILEYPMDKGSVVNGGWDAMERVWEHIYSKDNLSAKIDEHPVLLTESPLNPRSHREKTAEIFFETFRAPALFVAPPAILSLYAAGRTTGVVVDVGDGVTSAIPVYEGFALPHSICRSDIAGRDITKYFQMLMRRSGVNFVTTAEEDLVRSMKEDCCYIALNPGKEEETTTTLTTKYQLPDGQPIDLGPERFRAPEVLFRPSLVGSEDIGCADCLVQSIMKSDIDLRSTLFEQVVLAGGSTLFPGFGDRFLQEVRLRAPAHARIRISAPPERINSAWVGGSILASLATFKTLWVGRSEYEEHGTTLLHRMSL